MLFEVAGLRVRSEISLLLLLFGISGSASRAVLAAAAAAAAAASLWVGFEVAGALGWCGELLTLVCVVFEEGEEVVESVELMVVGGELCIRVFCVKMLFVDCGAEVEVLYKLAKKFRSKNC